MARRLAAILAADAVGYSRLIRADEDGTIAAIKELRETIFEPKLQEYDGRIVKLMGDGILAEFGSAVAAVKMAVDVQIALADWNAARKEERKIPFRVGINLGDIVVDGDDIQGDGVNVAARLEGLAEPGGLCISAPVYEQVRDRLDLYFEDMGEREVKNINRPVHAWRWATTASPVAAALETTTAPLALPDKPSIAVLPFDNMSGDAEQDFFADGMAEDIITALSRMPWFFVIARNSSFTYKGRAVDIKQVAAELGVKYVLEGSVRKSGKRIRITAQLIDAATGNHVWADRYDREIADIFEVQDEVTRAIVGAVAPEFLNVEGQVAKRKDASQLDAWECVMRGRSHIWKLARDDAAAAKDLFERAIQLDPNGEFGSGDLALVYFLEAFYGWSPSREDALDKMLEMAQSAVTANDKDPWALTILAWANIFARRWDEALPPVERAIEQSPNFAAALGFRGTILALLGDTDKGIASINEALRLSPRDSIIVFWIMGLFWAQFANKDYEDAVNTARQAIRLAPNNPTFRRQLAAAYAMLGRVDDAKSALQEYLKLEPTHKLADIRRIPSRVPEHLERFVEGVRRAGLAE